MNTIDDNGDDSTDRPRNANAPGGGYEWTCPYCGESRLNTSRGEPGRENAMTALRVHIYASDGTEHGPRRQYPAGNDTLALDDHVVEAGGREGTLEVDGRERTPGVGSRE